MNDLYQKILDSTIPKRLTVLYLSRPPPSLFDVPIQVCSSFIVSLLYLNCFSIEKKNQLSIVCLNIPVVDVGERLFSLVIRGKGCQRRIKEIY